LRILLRSYVADAAAEEWPMMAHRTATLQMIPYSLAEALQLTFALFSAPNEVATARCALSCRPTVCIVGIEKKAVIDFDRPGRTHKSATQHLSCAHPGEKRGYCVDFTGMGPANKIIVKTSPAENTSIN
jgi:hypothetical protein